LQVNLVIIIFINYNYSTDICVFTNRFLVYIMIVSQLPLLCCMIQ